jgi:hypothetical protein
MEKIKECKYTGAGKGRKEGRKEFNYIMGWSLGVDYC